MIIDDTIEIHSLVNPLKRFWELATTKTNLIKQEYNNVQGSPVFTIEGKYSTKGWTEWTQGFQYGIPLLIFEATGNTDMLQIGKRNTLERMAHHISHFGVHDHGFNNISTYGNLLRLGNLRKLKTNEEELALYRLALKLSGAVQAKRWTTLNNSEGYLYSFNGPHSLFIDTIRTCRSLLVSYQLGHCMLDENDAEINLLQRAITHATTTAKYAIYYGTGRDRFDVEEGRVVHESIFNINDGQYRCSNSQQGYSGYTTWTRGLGWAMLGFTEFLEFLNEEKPESESLEDVKKILLNAAIATCNFYIEHSSADGIPYWDTGAPNLYKLGDYSKSVSNPFNNIEPVDSSAAAIAAQGFLRLSNLLKNDNTILSKKYLKAGVLILKTLLSDTYLALDKKHQGILLHTIYHYPNNWDHIPNGSRIPNGESCMWGDYHIAEACLLAESIINTAGNYYTFFGAIR